MQELELTVETSRTNKHETAGLLESRSQNQALLHQFSNIWIGGLIGFHDPTRSSVWDKKFLLGRSKLPSPHQFRIYSSEWRTKSGWLVSNQSGMEWNGCVWGG